MWFLLLRRNPWSIIPFKRLIIPFDVTIPGISAIVIPFKCRLCSHYYRLELVRNFEFQASNEHWRIEMDGLRLVWYRTSCLKLRLFLTCIQGVFCSNFDRDAEYSEVFSGVFWAPGDCLNRALNLAFQAVSIAMLSISEALCLWVSLLETMHCE